MSWVWWIKLSITVQHESGKIVIQNRFYTVAFNTQVGGMINYLRSNETERSLITREGCEIWCQKWGGFTENHYQQERTGQPKLTVHREAGTIKIKVENVLGNAHGGKTRGSWCVNNWVFNEDTPLIQCSAQIGDPSAGHSDIASPNLFKKYICFYPGTYKYWAYKEEGGEIASGRIGWDNLTPHFKRNGAGYNFVLPRGRWATLFNDTRGFALILLDGTEPCDDLRFWQSKTMEELLYSYRSNEKSQLLPSLGYLEYTTTPEKKWKPVADIYEETGISTNT